MRLKQPCVVGHFFTGWSGLVGPQPREAKRRNQSSAIALRDGATPTRSAEPATAASFASHGAPGLRRPHGSLLHPDQRQRLTSCPMAPAPSSSTASEDRRLIEAAVERVAIRDGSIEIALMREAAEIVGEAAWSSPGGNRPRASTANSSRRSRGLITTRERRGRTPRPSCLPASPRPEAGSTNLSQAGFSTSPILRSGRSGPFDRPQCCCRWPFSPLVWSRPSPTIACPAASASRVLPTCRAAGPSSSRRSACKPSDRSPHPGRRVRFSASRPH